MTPTEGWVDLSGGMVAPLREVLEDEPGGDHLDSIADWEVEVCGESYDHDLVTLHADEVGLQYECRTCGAELWEDAEEDDDG